MSLVLLRGSKSDQQEYSSGEITLVGLVGQVGRLAGWLVFVFSYCCQPGMHRLLDGRRLGVIVPLHCFVWMPRDFAKGSR